MSSRDRPPVCMRVGYRARHMHVGESPGGAGRGLVGGTAGADRKSSRPGPRNRLSPAGLRLTRTGRHPPGRGVHSGHLHQWHRRLRTDVVTHQQVRRQRMGTGPELRAPGITGLRDADAGGPAPPAPPRLHQILGHLRWRCSLRFGDLTAHPGHRRIDQPRRTRRTHPERIAPLARVVDQVHRRRPVTRLFGSHGAPRSRADRSRGLARCRIPDPTTEASPEFDEFRPTCRCNRSIAAARDSTTSRRSAITARNSATTAFRPSSAARRARGTHP